MNVTAEDSLMFGGLVRRGERGNAFPNRNRIPSLSAVVAFSTSVLTLASEWMVLAASGFEGCGVLLRTFCVESNKRNWFEFKIFRSSIGLLVKLKNQSNVSIF
jgi:hypothetical protein